MSSYGSMTVVGRLPCADMQQLTALRVRRRESVK